MIKATELCDSERRAAKFRCRVASLVKRELLATVQAEGVSDFTAEILRGLSPSRNPGQAVLLSLVPALCTDGPLTRAIEKGCRNS